MEIYIEDTIFVNIISSFIICNLTLKWLKLRIKTLRLFLTIILSTIISILSVYITLNSTIYLIIKLSLGFLLSTLLTGSKSIKTLISSFMCFMLNTFLMGGVCYAISGFCGLNFQLNASSNLTVGLVLLSGLIYYISLAKLIKVFYSKKHINNYCYSVKLTINNITRDITGFLDTGNNIKYNNLPISIIPLNVAVQFDKNLSIISLLNQNKVLLPESCYIKYSTVSGQGTMLIFKPHKLEIKLGKNYIDFSNSYIGISLKNISSSNSYSILLNSYLI